MDPREFLNLAQLLAIGTPKAANLRTATSRAYYAAHHVGAEVLSGLGFVIKTDAGGHADVWNRLQNSGAEEVRVAGSQLADLYGWRLKADYRLRDGRAEKQANVRGHIEQARKIVQTLDQSCSGAARPQIIKAIKDWERLVQG